MSATSKAMLRKAISQARSDLAPAQPHPAPAACSCEHHGAPVQNHQLVTDAAVRGFRAAPVLTAAGGVLGVLAVLGMVTAALLAVAVTGLALALVSVVLLILIRMLRKEMSR